MAPSGIEPATFRLVVECLNHLRQSVLLPCCRWGQEVRRYEGGNAHAETNVFYPFPKTSTVTSCECTRNTVNVLGTGTTLPGRSEVSLAALPPCRLQLGTVLGTSASK
jgi:hypothetical protein